MSRLSLVVLVLFSLLTAACGVRFVDADPGTEFFTEIEISGEMRVGAPLTVYVQYEQFYPIDVTFHCELRRKKEIIKRLGEQIVAPLDNGGPDQTPFPGAIAFDFTVDAPGTYIVECLTEKDQDNFIGDEITVAPAGDSAPTP